MYGFTKAGCHHPVCPFAMQVGGFKEMEGKGPTISDRLETASQYAPLFSYWRINGWRL